MKQSDHRGIEFNLLIPAEVKCEYTGIPQGDFYTDIDRTIEVFERFPEAFERVTGYRPPVTHPVPATAYEGVAALGGVLEFPRDHQPMLRNQGRVLTSVDEIDRLEAPDPDDYPRFRTLLAWRNELSRRFPDESIGGIAGQEGPITTAVLLRGQEFFIDCVADQDRAHRLLDVCTEMFVTWNLRSRKECGATSETASICDDHAGLLGPSLWDEYVIPAYKRIIEALGPKGLWLHTELVNRQHLPHLRVLPMIGVNFAEDQYLTIEDVFDTLPGIPFGWHILTVPEMQQGTPELIDRRCREIIESGVKEIRCELTVNTPPENIRAFLEAERNYSHGIGDG